MGEIYVFNKYKFFKEYSDGQAIVTSFLVPDDIVVAATIDEAIEKFLKRGKLKQESCDILSDHEWRIFVNKKKLFRESIEKVFYIKQEE